MAERYVEKWKKTRTRRSRPKLSRPITVLRFLARLEGWPPARLFGPPLAGAGTTDRRTASAPRCKQWAAAASTSTRAPQEALDLVLAARAPPEDTAELGTRKPRVRGATRHAAGAVAERGGKWVGPAHVVRRSRRVGKGVGAPTRADDVPTIPSPRRRQDGGATPRKERRRCPP